MTEKNPQSEETVTPSTETGGRQELVKRKREMIADALKKAQEGSSKPAKEGSMKKGMIIYETNEDQKAGPDDIDGMEEMLGDDILDTDWDIECENPPHAHLAGLDLHGKQGKP